MLISLELAFRNRFKLWHQPANPLSRVAGFEPTYPAPHAGAPATRFTRFYAGLLVSRLNSTFKENESEKGFHSVFQKIEMQNVSKSQKK